MGTNAKKTRDKPKKYCCILQNILDKVDLRGANLRTNEEKTHSEKQLAQMRAFQKNGELMKKSKKLGKSRGFGIFKSVLFRITRL
jgi:hypothetical protein